MSLSEKEKNYIITEAVNILKDENREDLVDLLHRRLEEEETLTASQAGEFDKQKLDQIVWAVTKTLFNQEAKFRKKGKT